MPRARTVLLRTGLVLLLVVALAALAAWWVVGTERGGRFAVREVADRFLPGDLEIGRTRGPLGGPLVLEDVVYETDTLRLEVERLAIEWRLAGLFRERLDVYRLDASGVTVVRKAAAERKDDPLPDVDLPFDVVVHAATLRDIRILRGDEEPVEIASIEVETEVIGDVVTVDRLAIRSPLFDVDLVGEVRPQGAYPVDLEVEWETDVQEGVHWAGSGTVRGDLEHLAIDQRFTAPTAAHLVATLDEPFLDLAFDGTVTAAPFDPALVGLDELPVAVTTVGGTVRARGELEVFTAEGDLDLATPEYGPLAADVVLARDHRVWTIERLVATRPGGGPPRITLAGDVRPGDDGAAGPPRFDFRVSWRGLPWPLEGEPVLRSSQGSGRIAGTGESWVVEADALVAAGPVPEGRWSGVLRGGGEALEVRRLVGRVDGGEVRARGTVVPGETPRLDLTASWTDLGWPLEGEPTVTSSAGEATLTGTLADYRLEVDAALDVPPVGEGRLVLTGRGDRERLDVASARAGLFGGTVTASGRVAWRPVVAWDLELRGEGLDPATWREGFPGDLDVVAVSEGRMTDDGPVGTLAPLRVAGTLRGAPLEAAGALALAGGVTTVSDLDVAWGGARLAAEGTVGERWDLAFRASVPDLALVADGAAGRVAAEGRLTGTGPLPAVAAELDAEEVVWGGVAVASIEGELAVDLAADAAGAMAVDLVARDVAWGERVFPRVAVESDGVVGDHVLRVVAEHENETLRVELAGGLDVDRRRWAGTLRDLQLAVEGFGRWRLEEPAALAVSTAVGVVDRFCLDRVDIPGSEAALCAGGSWRQGGDWRVLGALATVPLDLAAPLLPASVGLTGPVDGILRLRGRGDRLFLADVDLRPGPGTLTLRLGGRPETFEFERGAARLYTSDAGLAGRVDLRFPDVGRLAAEGLLPGYRRLGMPPPEQPVTAEVVADVDDLGWVAALSRRFSEVTGRLDALFTVSGTVGEPRPEGSIALADAGARLDDWGVVLEDLQVVARSDGSEAFDVAGTVTSGEGTLRLGGRLALVPSPESPVRLEVTGDRFTAVDRADLKVLASPEVVATYDGRRLEVAGEIVIPEAEVEYEGREEGVIQPSRDVVVVAGGGERERTFRDLDLVARLRLTLGEEVHVTALGLEADVEGSLLVLDEPSAPVTAIGELYVVDGTYTAYGQDLEIERGRLFFAGGPLDDPGVDVRAFRRAEGGVVAGIEVDGRLRAPEVEVWSEPDMAETDALAYLLLGRPLATAGESDASLLARAATGLGVRGGNLLVGRLAEQAGLEDVRIETDGDIEEASFVVGKYLSPGLYVSYGIGLFEPVSTFRIRYTLSSKWSLEAEVGEGTSADVLYTIERQ